VYAVCICVQLLIIAAVNLVQPLSGLSDAERVSTCFLPLATAANRSNAVMTF